MILTGRRLSDLTAAELCNFVYYDMVTKITDPEQRTKFEAAIRGQLGARGGYIINDPLLPESMQGREAPTWWDPKHDPLSDQQRLTNTSVG